MAKNITKQVLIAILTIIAVSLVLALVLYKYTPSNKVVPAKVQAYTTPEDVASEISDDAAEQKYETTNQVLEVTNGDLENYKNSKSYNPGKSDPFAEYKEENTNAPENTTSGENSGSSATTGTTGGSTTSTTSKSTSSVDANAKDQYYEDAGINKGTK